MSGYGINEARDGWQRLNSSEAEDARRRCRSRW
jgi:hypothetical protein